MSKTITVPLTTDVCMTLDITGSTIINLFTTETIERIFEKIGKLEKNSFNISRMVFADNSCRIIFHYPTDMNSLTSADFFDGVLAKMKDMTLEEFNYTLFN